MAVLTMDFCSQELKMNTLVTVVIPDSVRIGNTPLSERKVLWLLHGLSGDGSDWVRRSRIEDYVQEAGLVAVMPSAGRSMYCDGVMGQNYFTHIAEELPEYLSLVFGLSRKREGNFIAGLSMGGLGAAKLALSYPERYAAMGSFSGLLDLEPLLPRLNGEWREEFPFLLNVLPEIRTSPLNPVALLDTKRVKDLRIYVACGLQDDLLLTNYSFQNRCRELGINIHSVFEEGAHEWGFWDRHVKKFIDFMLERHIGQN